jgi:hypothetical protein
MVLSESARLTYLNSQSDGEQTPLMWTASAGNIEALRIRYRAGADLEICNHTRGTALMIAYRVGQLSSVKCLVRLGVKTECSIDGRILKVLNTARNNQDIGCWFLVERYLDQQKLSNTSFNHEDEIRLRYWSGTRTMGIPLQGVYERPKDVALMEYTRHLYLIMKGGWGFLVPLGWDTVAYFVPLPWELKK